MVDGTRSSDVMHHLVVHHRVVHHRVVHHLVHTPTKDKQNMQRSITQTHHEAGRHDLCPSHDPLPWRHVLRRRVDHQLLQGERQPRHDASTQERVPVLGVKHAVPRRQDGQRRAVPRLPLLKGRGKLVANGGPQLPHV